MDVFATMSLAEMRSHMDGMHAHGMHTHRPSVVAMPSARGSLDRRPSDFSGNDYEELLRLDEGIKRRGLSKRALCQLRRFTAHQKHSGKECAASKETIHVGDTMVCLPCRHSFLERGVRGWFRENRTCPVCRCEIEP